MNQLNLYGVIGSDVRSVDVKKALLEMDQTQELVVKIDSEGGSVIDGFSIANALEAYPGPKRIIVEPSAFSIASYIVAVFDNVEIVSNGYIMAHFPYDMMGGTSEELKNKAALLENMETKFVERYVAKTGKTEEEVREMLRKEVFFDAEESVAAGLASSIIGLEAKARATPTAKHRDMPTRVYAALFGANLGGDESETTEEQSMSNAQPAATVQEIKAAHPKASADFILACVERSLPMAQVSAEYTEEQAKAMEELMSENEELKAKLSAMEEEMSAKAMEEEEPEAMEEEEKPVARARGAKPVANAAKPGVTSASERWNEAVAAEVARGASRPNAVLACAKKNPGLHAEYIAEANA